MVLAFSEAAGAQAQAVPEPPPDATIVVPQYGAPSGPPSAYVPYSTPLPPAPPPPRVVPVPVERTESLRALWLPGLIVLPITWLSTWVGASSGFTGDAVTYAYVPIVGPWLMLTQDLKGEEHLAVLSGVLQGAAAIAIVLGLSIQRTVQSFEYRVVPAPGTQLSFEVSGARGGAMLIGRLSL